jgi:4-hydroxy-3-methylbut-2-enyl diphosphate reductase
VNILLAQPRGFCAGVIRAIDIVEQALRLYGAPVYVYHEIVHNPHVVKDLERKGAIFVNELEAIPAGGVTIFSAHGVSKRIEQTSKAMGHLNIDATCPLVAKVHAQAERFVAQGYHLVLIGHAGHDEVIGTIGRVDAPVSLVGCVSDVYELPFTEFDPVAYVTQTTLSLNDTLEIIMALKKRYPKLLGPELEGICYATQNRQHALKALTKQVEAVVVVGGKNSSNSARLVEVALKQGVRAVLVERAEDLDPNWVKGVERLGVTAGASTPETLLTQVLEQIQENCGPQQIQITQTPGEQESTVFKLPSQLSALSQ